MLEELRDWEEGARPQPTRDVVLCDLVEQGFAWQSEDVVLQLFEVMDACYLFACFRIAEDEISESEIFAHHVTQIHIHLLRVLVDEVVARALGTFRILGLGTVHYERDIWVDLADSIKELEACQLVFLFFGRTRTLDRSHWESAVADYTEGIVAVSAI